MIIVALILRQLLRGRRYGTIPALDLDAYETAYLVGGENQAIETVIAVLVHRKVLKVEKSDRRLIAHAALPSKAHMLERAIFDAAGRSGEFIRAVRADTAGVAKELAARIRGRGLISDDGAALSVQIVPPLLVLGVTIFGAIKILIGLSRGRPVGFLFILTTLSLIVAWYLFKVRPRLTFLGELFVSYLKERNAALEQTARTHSATLDRDDLAMALALFGISALAIKNGSLKDLRAALRPSSSGLSGSHYFDGSSSGSVWISSSCGSSSCSSSSCSSGGSSCGGGGGGCGGCGSS